MRRTKPHIISLVGARPQFIKLAALTGALSKKTDHVIIHAGQHYDRVMSEVFFDELAIPEVALNLAVGSGSHANMTAHIMMRFERLLLEKCPDLVLVYGDTNTTVAGALTAAKLNIPVGHIEAGLRSFRRDMPEEINRVMTDHLSSLLFCPTPVSVKNLREEGIGKGVVRSGDLMYELIDNHRGRIAKAVTLLKRHGVRRHEYLLLTLHRAGNVDDEKRLAKIVDILARLPYQIIFPLHPRTRKNLNRFGLRKSLEQHSHVHLIEPLSYLDNLRLIAAASAVLTDSGGMQKESVFLGTPCLTLRDETEWPETLKRGNQLVGLSERKIKSRLSSLKRTGRVMPFKIRNLTPSNIITDSIMRFLKG